MKKNYFTLLLIAICCSITCIAQKNGEKTVDLSLVQVEALSAVPNLMVNPLIVDIQIINGAKTSFEKDYYININASDLYKLQSLPNIKTKALFEFTDQQNAEIIVSPIFSITTEMDPSTGENVLKNGYLMKINVKIKGTPARYVNYRNAKETDLWIQKVMYNKTNGITPIDSEMATEKTIIKKAN